MNIQRLVSIIIPTYNRAHLIAETLDSVLAQTYQDWECIIVDDGSKDATDEVVDAFVQKDRRFKYYKRSSNYAAGGNGARNYGLDLAKGEFIVFFDSDDLMSKNHLEVKYKLITSGDYDFGITRTKYFNYTNEFIDRYYNFSTKDISKENYVLQHINWLTLDVIIKALLAKQMRFNELIKSGQEYNYFSKLVCLSDHGVFKNEVVSLRRHHNNSKRTTLAVGSKKSEGIAITTWFTFLETRNDMSDEIQHSLLLRTYRAIIRFKAIPKEINSTQFWKVMSHHYKSKVMIKFIYYHINKHTDRFHFLRKKALSS
ncbi:MAG: glycosyltransferase family 2 protein [Psychroflexus halocasei]